MYMYFHIWIAHNMDCILYVFYLQLIVSGLGKIDIEDWKLNTRLKHCTPDSNVVKWFWAIVDSFDEEKRARLLQFVTGSCRVPLQVNSSILLAKFVSCTCIVNIMITKKSEFVR